MVAYNGLPLEIIANIYKYLDLTDIKAAQLTCHQWLNASCLREVQNRSILLLTSLNDSIQELFQQSFRPFPNVHLMWQGLNNDQVRESEEQLIQFFSIKNISNNLRVLILYDITNSIKSANLYKILKSLPILVEFECFEENKYNTESVLENSGIISNFTSTNIRSLSFDCWMLSDRNLEIFSEIKNLEELNITTYIKNELSIPILSQILKNNEIYLKKLTLKHDTIDELFQSQHNLSNLKLKEISFSFKSEHAKFIDFFKVQNSITNLTIENSDEINDTEMTEILKNLPLLEKLDIDNNSKLTDITMFQISKLKNLKYLNINEFNGIGSDGIIKGLAKDKNMKIIELKCEHTHFSGEAYRMISENLPNLQILHCGYLKSNDGAIQHIKNCKNLIELSIWADKISYYDIIGIDFNTGENTGSSLSELEKLECLKLRCDYTDERFPHIENSCKQEFLSKLKLKNLLVLDLWFSPNTSEESELQCFNLLSACTKNSPNIKKISLHSGSYKGGNRIDSAMEIIIKKLTKLKQLNITTECKNIDKIWITQNAFLNKNRKDLSSINIDCPCDTCIKLKSVCATFIEKK